MGNEQKKTGKQFEGVVKSTSMNKTVVVEIIRTMRHPLYKKTIKKSRRFKVHSEIKEVKVGDTVRIIESKPISKDTHFCVQSIITK